MANVHNPFLGLDPQGVAMVEKSFLDAGVSPQQVALIKKGNEGAIKKAIPLLQASYMAGLSRITARNGAEAAANIHGWGQRIAQGEHPLDVIPGL